MVMSAVIAPLCFDLTLWLLFSHFWSVAVQPRFLRNHCWLFFRSCIFQASCPDLLLERFNLSRFEIALLMANCHDLCIFLYYLVVRCQIDKLCQVQKDVAVCLWKLNNCCCHNVSTSRLCVNEFSEIFVSAITV